MITAALTVHRAIHFDFTASLADGLVQGTGTSTATGRVTGPGTATGTGTGMGTESGTGASRRLRPHCHPSDNDNCKNDKFNIKSIYINEPSAELFPVPFFLQELIERKRLRMIRLALGVMISGHAADDG